MNKRRENYSLLKSLLALSLVLLCLWAAQWQYHRGVDRHARNSVVEENSNKAPQPLEDLLKDVPSHEWQPVIATGRFDTSNQVLLRNRYFEGVYGFQVLTRFNSTTGKSFWVDCGWVKAGPNAATQPDIPFIPSDQVTIKGRLRLDTALPQGSFFAIPVGKSQGLIAQADSKSQSRSENFYLDLINGNRAELTPAVPAELPELSDGPHLAYALQWLFFGALVIYGRILIRRDVLARK